MSGTVNKLLQQQRMIAESIAAEQDRMMRPSQTCSKP